MMTKKCRELWAAWNRAYAETGEVEAEQWAWDALVDFVEANGMNGTEWDPRGVKARS